MSTELPRLEARMSAQERTVTILHARIEEWSQDMTASFRQLAEYQSQTERQMEARFDKLEAQIAGIQATMATKEDLAGVRAEMTTMETRLLDTFKQLLTMIDTRLPPPQATGEM